MAVSCPQCGSRVINLARLHTTSEWLQSLLGTRPLRCRDCRSRFKGKTFEWSDLLFAKCPNCFRMDLNVWYKEHWRARGWMAVKLALGGMRMRCEYCRVNFVSMRRRKERFTFNRWSRQQSNGDQTTR